MIQEGRIKYLSANAKDRLWGMAVTSVGFQSKRPDEIRASGYHPPKYAFMRDTGRILDEYQLIYLTHGKGKLWCNTLGRDNPIVVNEGDMFFLFPGEWHTYYPDDGCFWDEYWIGFQGEIADHWLENGLISKDSPLISVGILEDIAEMYRKAINLATRQNPGYQQALGGIAAEIVGCAMYYGQNLKCEDRNQEIITLAKIMVADEISTITPGQLADKLNINYSIFRKLFKSHTGFAPGQYINEIKIQKAKELLLSTDMSVKAISFELGFENQDYFVTMFKKKTGKRPSEYRFQ